MLESESNKLNFNLFSDMPFRLYWMQQRMTLMMIKCSVKLMVNHVSLFDYIHSK